MHDLDDPQEYTIEEFAAAAQAVRTASMNHQIPAHLRDLLEGPLNAEQFERAASAQRRNLDELREGLPDQQRYLSPEESLAASIPEVLEAIETWEEATEPSARTQAEEDLLAYLDELTILLEELG